MKLPVPTLSRLTALTLAGTLGLALAPSPSPLRAADHGDAPSIDHDSGADIADAFLFLDPNDNSRVVIAMTVHGFIVPGEALNFATFDPKVKFSLNIENTGDAVADKSVLVTFSEKPDAVSPQIATVNFAGQIFTAPTTAPTLAATPNPQIITTDAATGIKFFAGEVDDPFFFDLVAFNRFVASVKVGAPNPAVFNRGRDVFAGYNILAIALSVPVEMVRGTVNVVGLEARTKREEQTALRIGGYSVAGRPITVDRTGNPAINVALIPFGKKDAYNASTTAGDAAGKFVPDILATLKLFGTDAAHTQALADIAVTHGDFLHMNLGVPNSGPMGGTNPGAGFPNGRRLADDVIDTILTVINNGNKLGDNVNASDIPPQSAFPFFALPHQPLGDPAIVDDGTRN